MFKNCFFAVRFIKFSPVIASVSCIFLFGEVFPTVLLHVAMCGIMVMGVGVAASTVPLHVYFTTDICLHILHEA